VIHPSVIAGDSSRKWYTLSVNPPNPNGGVQAVGYEIPKRQRVIAVTLENRFSRLMVRKRQEAV
jgi:hypothetical protein